MNIFLFLKKINKISYIFINIIILLFSNFAFANEEKMQRVTNFLIDTSEVSIEEFSIFSKKT
jgi:hypothetical protein